MNHNDEALFDLHEIAGPGMLNNPKWRFYNGPCDLPIYTPLNVRQVNQAVHQFPDTIFNVRIAR